MSDNQGATSAPTLEEALAEIEGLKEQLSGSDLKVFTQNRELRQENGKLREEVTRLTEECVTQTFAVRGLEKTRAKLEQQVAELTATVADLQSSLADRESKIADLESKLSEETQKVAQLEGRASELTEQLGIHRSQEIHLSQELEMVRTTNAEEVSKLKAEHSHELENTRQTLEQARAQLEQELSEKLAAKALEVEGLEKRVEQFKEEFLSQEIGAVGSAAALPQNDEGRAFRVLRSKMEGLLGFPGKTLVEQVFRHCGADENTSDPAVLEEAFEALQDTASKLVRNPEQEQELASLLKSAWQDLGLGSTDGASPVATPAAAQPAAEEAAPEPVTEEVAPEPVTEEVAPEPVAEEAAPEPVTEEAAPEPVAEEAAPEPVAEEAAPEPVAEEAAPEPVAEEAAPEPVAEEVAPEPVAEEAAPEPVAEEAAPEPVAEEAAPEPVAEEAAPEPAAEEAAPEPVAEEAAPEPAAEEAAPEPAAEEAAPAPVAEEAAPETVTEEVAPEPVAEEAAPVPVAEEAATEPIAEEAAAEPAAEEAVSVEAEQEPTVEAAAPVDQAAPEQTAEVEDADFDDAAAALQNSEFAKAWPLFHRLRQSSPSEPTYLVGEIASLAGLERYDEAYALGKGLRLEDLEDSADVYRESFETVLMSLAEQSESLLARKGYLIELLDLLDDPDRAVAVLDEVEEIRLRTPREGQLSLLQARHRIAQDDVTEYLIEALSALSDEPEIFDLLQQNLDRYPELTSLKDFMERLLGASRDEALEAETAAKELVTGAEEIEDLLEEVDPGEEALVQVFLEHLLPRTGVKVELPSEAFEELLAESEPAAFVGALRQALRSVDYTVFFDEIEVLSYDGEEHFLLRSSPEPKPTLLFGADVDDVPPEELRFLVLRELFSMYRRHSHLNHLAAQLDDKLRITFVKTTLEIHKEAEFQIPEALLNQVGELAEQAEEGGHSPEFRARLEELLNAIYQATESDSFLELADFLFDGQLHKKWLDPLADAFAAKQTGVVVASFAIARDAMEAEDFEALEEAGFIWLYNPENLDRFRELRLRLQRLWVMPFKALVSDAEAEE